MEYLTCTSELKAIADAIRTRGKTSAPLNYPMGFIDAISNISTQPILSSVTVLPTEDPQIIQPDSTFDAFSAITVTAIPSDYVGAAVTRRSSADITMSGSIATIPQGYFSLSANAIFPNGSAFVSASTLNVTPSINILPTGVINVAFNSAITIVPSVEAGYISEASSGILTITGSSTYQLQTQTSTLYSPADTVQLAISVGTYITDNITLEAVSSTYIGSLIVRLSENSYIPTSYSQYISSQQYTTGIQTIVGDSNFVASNIKEGVQIYNITGTYSGYESITGIPMQRIIENRNSAFGTVYSNSTIEYIGAGVFAYNSALSSINMQNCSTIGSSAFYWASNLRSASFPNCKIIYDLAFYYNQSLYSIYFPICEIVGSSAFYQDKRLQSVSMPECSIIEQYAFYSCSSLSFIYFPKCEVVGTSAFDYCKIDAITMSKCSYIGTDAFQNNTTLTGVNFGACKEIGDGAFAYCNLNHAVFGECEKIGDGAFRRGGSSGDPTFIFPKAKILGAACFYSCYSLKSISLPLCETVGGTAFGNCYSLTSIELPLCTSIGINTFSYCRSLSFVSIPLITYLPSGIFQYCSNINSVYCPECSIIYENAFYNAGISEVFFSKCESLERSAFGNALNLTSVSFPLCTIIGFDCFRSCSALTYVSFPKVEMISGSSFLSCTNLTSITLPECTNLGGYTFSNCINLSFVSLNNVSIIGNFCFANCYNLLSLYVLTSSVPTVQSKTFSSTPISDYTVSTGGAYGSIYVYSSMIDAFLADSQWTLYSDRIVGI